MKPSSRLKSVARHTILWIIWFGLKIFALIIDNTSKYSATDWMYQAYNYISVLIVFYFLAYLFVHLFYEDTVDEYVILKDFSDFKNILNVESVSIVLIIVLYVILGATLDSMYFGYKYPGVDAYVYERFDSVLLYIVSAAGYATYKITKKMWLKKSSAEGEEEIANEMK
jgi:hypothetical protein